MSNRLCAGGGGGLWNWLHQKIFPNQAAAHEAFQAEAARKALIEQQVSALHARVQCLTAIPVEVTTASDSEKEPANDQKQAPTQFCLYLHDVPQQGQDPAASLQREACSALAEWAAQHEVELLLLDRWQTRPHPESLQDVAQILALLLVRLQDAHAGMPYYVLAGGDTPWLLFEALQMVRKWGVPMPKLLLLLEAPAPNITVCDRELWLRHCRHKELQSAAAADSIPSGSLAPLLCNYTLHGSSMRALPCAVAVVAGSDLARNDFRSRTVSDLAHRKTSDGVAGSLQLAEGEGEGCEASLHEWFSRWARFTTVDCTVVQPDQGSQGSAPWLQSVLQLLDGALASQPPLQLRHSGPLSQMYGTGRVRVSLNVEDWLPTAAEWASALAMIPSAEKAEVLRFKHRIDQKRAMGSRLLQRLAISHTFSIKPSSVEILRTAEGKPYWANQHLDETFHNYNYNVSHHGNYVALASDPDIVVGVDIMENSAEAWGKLLRNDTLDEFLENFRRELTFEEWELVTRAGSEDITRRLFLQLWTMKEAYIKANGLGLGFDLNRIGCYPDIDGATPSITIDGWERPEIKVELGKLDQHHVFCIAEVPLEHVGSSFRSVLRSHLRSQQEEHQVPRKAHVSMPFNNKQVLEFKELPASEVLVALKMAEAHHQLLA